MLNLDTHVILFALNDELRPSEEKLVSESACGISQIVLWEISKLHRLRRTRIHVDDPEFLALLPQLTLWPITVNVCRSFARLDFRSDPADELIAATSVALTIPLLTRDKKIRASRGVPLAL